MAGEPGGAGGRAGQHAQLHHLLSGAPHRGHCPPPHRPHRGRAQPPHPSLRDDASPCFIVSVTGCRSKKMKGDRVTPNGVGGGGGLRCN
jgi:hypothetical protein